MGKPITIVQGGQYGSEAKGAIAAYLCEKNHIDICVRTGATNAGHTCYYAPTPESAAVEVKLQQLPVGFVNPDTKLILGAGTLIDPTILEREVKLLSRLTGTDIRHRLMIDRRAALHLPEHQKRSADSGRHHSMGATGKGCSEALIDRIRNRGSDSPVLFGDSPLSHDYDTGDTEAFLNFSWNEGASIMLEGTQGQLLDLYLGPYPYVTHKQTGPAQWMLESGLSPSLPTHIVMVTRTYPIRVAGNSGPLPDEISWPMLARTLNDKRDAFGLPPIVAEWALEEFEQTVRASSMAFLMPHNSDGLDQHQWSPADRVAYKVALSELNAMALGRVSEASMVQLRRLFELTTVTRKLRRIAACNVNDLRVSARQMRPASVAITFMNYELPQYWYSNESPKAFTEAMDSYQRAVEYATNAPVQLMSFGRESKDVIEVPSYAVTRP